MEFIVFVKGLLTGILVTYLSFTNTLATHLESFFFKENATETRQDEMVPVPEEEKLTHLIDDRSSLSRTISRVLLEHRDFQRAATIASNRDEVFDTSNDGLTVSDSITKALVNIYCQYKTDNYIRTTTGTGFFINPKGVIITNAHVAQFLLLEGAEDVIKEVDCVIRSGDPAEPKYKAELLYISPTWIFENADLITTESPRGTGERDYALLYVSRSIDDTPLPIRFPSLAVDTALLSRSIERTSVITAGYPAEALMRSGAHAKLLPIVASTTISTLYTFGSNYADIFAISESPVGEQGASGGPIVVPESRYAIGLIVTKGDEQTEGARSLRALTLSYIDRTMIEETGFSLVQNMRGDLALRGNVFKKVMTPFLADMLTEELAQ